MEIFVLAKEIYNTNDLIDSLENMGMKVQKFNNINDVNYKITKPELIIYFCTRDEGLIFNKIALQHSLKWIPVNVSYNLARIGPIFIPNETACYNCLDLRMKAGNIPSLTNTDKVLDLAFSLLCKIISIEILKLYSRSTPSIKCNLVNQILDVNLLNLSGELSRVYYVPSCPECGVESEFNAELQFIKEKAAVNIYD